MAEEKEKKEEYEVWPVNAKKPLGEKTKSFFHEGKVVELPSGWCVVPSGDAGLTRKIKASCEYWVIHGLYKKRTTNIGLCAPQDDVERLKVEIEATRETSEYQKKLEQGRRYRDNKQQAYASDFEQEVFEFLHFAERWTELAHRLAHAVAAHATPVGSGTVARTTRISIEERAEAALIAWMRHRTSNYDKMHIDRIQGERRRVRGEIAMRSREILKKYRSGADVDLANCPLARALEYP